MNQLLFAIGLTMIFLGLVAIILGLLVEMTRKGNEDKNEEQKTEYGGVIFIGPIPIVFGSNKKIAKTMLIIGVIIFVIFFVLALISYL